LSVDELRRKRVLEGKVLVQQEDGSFVWKKRGEVEVDLVRGNLVAEEVEQCHPDETGTATKEFRFVRQKRF